MASKSSETTSMASSTKVDGVYRSRSLGVPAIGIADQYADGAAAKVWELYMGGRTSRTTAYKAWMDKILSEHGVKTVLDAACGTGVDSIMLLDMGYTVVSSDASDKMLKYALEERWDRRKEEAFDKWVIKEANWLTMKKDLESVEESKDGFDAVLCMGNSFAHLPDFKGHGSVHHLAIENFYSMVKPGGILIVDHRNYDTILRTGVVPPGNNVYYSGKYTKHIACSNLYVDSLPTLTTLDYMMDLDAVEPEKLVELDIDPRAKKDWTFRLSYYPHKLDSFQTLLKDVFGPNSKYQGYGDFELLDSMSNPAYYLHVIQKPL